MHFVVLLIFNMFQETWISCHFFQVLLIERKSLSEYVDNLKNKISENTKALEKNVRFLSGLSFASDFLIFKIFVF